MNKQDAIGYLEDLLATCDCLNFHYGRHDEAIKMGISALEKQIPKKPIEEEKQYSEDYGFNSDILCPVCNNYIGYYTEAMSKPEYMQYCNQCGQRIDDDWSGEDE